MQVKKVHPTNAVAVMYPLVTEGPMNIDKAKWKLKFVPTPMLHVLEKKHVVVRTSIH